MKRKLENCICSEELSELKSIEICSPEHVLFKKTKNDMWFSDGQTLTPLDVVDMVNSYIELIKFDPEKKSFVLGFLE